jgi:hypothetical protein
MSHNSGWIELCDVLQLMSHLMVQMSCQFALSELYSWLHWLSPKLYEGSAHSGGKPNEADTRSNCERNDKEIVFFSVFSPFFSDYAKQKAFNWF